MKRHMRWVCGLAAGWMATGAAIAAERTFTFEDPKGVNAVSFFVDSLLEPILGYANMVGGTVTVDPENPKSFRATFDVPVKAVTTPNRIMTEHLHGPKWLDAETHPDLTFVSKEVLEVREVRPNVREYRVAGVFSARGVEQPLEVTIQFTHLPGRLGDRMSGSTGDLAVVRATFKISRRAFKINPEVPVEVVGDEIEIRVAISGGAPRDAE
jgi:polyisoprenoid-binding protein YceI